MKSDILFPVSQQYAEPIEQEKFQMYQCDEISSMESIPNNLDLMQVVDRLDQLILDLQFEECNQNFCPKLPFLSNPCSIKYPNSEVLNSSTLSIQELLRDERQMDFKYQPTENEFYQECLYEIEKTFKTDLPSLPIQTAKPSTTQINFNQEKLQEFFQLIRKNLFQNVNAEVQQLLEFFFSAVEIPNFAFKNSVFDVLMNQNLFQVEFKNVLITNKYKITQFPRADSLVVLIETLQKQKEFHAMRMQCEKYEQFLNQDYVQCFGEEFIGSTFEEIDEQVLQELILVALMGMFSDNQFTELINQQQFEPAMIDQEHNLHCMPNFEFTSLPYCCDTFKNSLQKKYENSQNQIMEPLLKDKYDILFSNAGNVFNYSETMQQYMCDLTNGEMKHFVQQKEIIEEPVVIVKNELEGQIQQHQLQVITELTLPDYNLITIEYKKSVLPTYGYFNQNQPSLQLEQLREKCRKMKKMMDTCRKNLIRRYRVNKNANQINSECTRAKKIVSDYEQLKKKIQSEGKSVKIRRWTGQRRVKDSSIQSTVVNQTINQRLDETEALVKDMCQGLYLNDEEILQQKDVPQSDLKIKILPTPQSFNGVLKHYQKMGFSWLVNMFNQNLNPLLCDQMGLGKTIQVIAFFLHLYENVQAGPFLVVCPNSLLNNWVSELKRFSDVLNVWPYWGNVQQRETIRKGFQHLVYCHTNQSGQDEKEIFGEKKCPLHVLITSYSLAVQDIKFLNKIPWLSIVLDEGQMIKSSETKRWHAMMEYKTQNKILLSGTPIQNSLDELWSLLHFVMPDVFQSKENFADWFGKDVEQAAIAGLRLNNEQLKRLHDILQPFVLRREKKDVASQLGEKIEKELKCRMTSIQSKFYQQIKRQMNISTLIQNGKDEDLNNLVMQLRKATNHIQIFNRNSVQMPFVLKVNDKAIHIAAEEEIDEEVSMVTTAVPESDVGFTLTLDGQLLNGCVSKFKTSSAKPTLQLLSDVTYSLARLSEHDSGYLKREGQLFYSIRNDQGLLGFQIPKCVYELVEPKCGFNAKNKQTVFCNEEVFDGLRPIVAVSNQRFEDVMHLFVLLSSVNQNANPLQHPFNKRLFSQMDTFEHLFQMYFRSTYYQSRYQIDLKFIIQNQSSKFLQLVKEKCVNFAPVLFAPNARQHRLQIPQLLMNQLNYDLMHFGGLDQLLQESGKLQQLDRLLKVLFEAKQICLIYCQMTRMMDILEDYLSYKSYKFVRLDGQMTVAERKTVVDKFMTDQSIFVFLLSTRAGSLGLNLTRANNVIFYESDWNPTSDAQASDRVHRIGQTKNVQIWKIIAENTVDERIIRRAEEKQRMQQLVLSGQQRDQFGNLIKKKSQREVLEELLKEE